MTKRSLTGRCMCSTYGLRLLTKHRNANGHGRHPHFVDCLADFSFFSSRGISSESSTSRHRTPQSQPVGSSWPALVFTFIFSLDSQLRKHIFSYILLSGHIYLFEFPPTTSAALRSARTGELGREITRRDSRYEPMHSRLLLATAKWVKGDTVNRHPKAEPRR
ncbi:hypothetical protein BCR34DRAFT_232341 [Clohesyomyces aquaticus]|uniref:Uncharacterized protein n=1 Tax=Clohesyomyces aquaticus TaxID=1231657 RepID=A0A1Y1ZWH1_9PLEO|nr:hypothetical protein BCR34DRAFT_232341 [Clohesyomyces aquaticus]